MLCSGHLSRAGKRFCPQISVYWSKSHKHNLSKVDTCLKRTKILFPKVSALDSFHCVVQEVNENYRLTFNCVCKYYLVTKRKVSRLSPISYIPKSRDHSMHFPFTKQKKQGINDTAGVIHPLSYTFKIHFIGIPSTKVTNPASRKRPA